jgi:hypothetical protein
MVAPSAPVVRAADPPPAPVPTVKMPSEVKIPPGRLASIVIESNGKVTKFGCLSSEVDVFREYDPDPTKIRVRVIAYTPGKYAIFAYTAMGDVPSEPAICWLTVGDPPPPTPPTPPTPPMPCQPCGSCNPCGGNGFNWGNNWQQQSWQQLLGQWQMQQGGFQNCW